MQKNVLEYLEATAARFPEKIAFADEKQSFTFGQMLELSQRCGSAIARQIGCVNRPVAVLTDRTSVSVLAFFSVLYSGNFYVPVDKSMPQQRMELQMRTLDPAAFLFPEDAPDIQSAYTDLCPCLEMALLLESPAEPDLLAQQRSKVLDIDPVYAIFTSGSTGVPKGIVCHHRGVIDLADWLAEAASFSEADVLGNQAPFFFDGSVKDIYITIKCGVTCHIFSKKLFAFPKLLIQEMNRQKVTALQWATSAFHLVAVSGVLERYTPQYVSKVLLGGEALWARDVNTWRSALPNARYINLYGPTETTVDAAWYEVEREFADDDVIPVGRACGNKEILLLDENQRPVSNGQVGEICVRGSGVSKGYFGDWEKTAAAFIQNPLRPWYMDTIYRTGDLGYIGPDGLLYFSSRQDGQIKHGGYRIELGEVETALNSQPGVTAGVCLFDAGRDKIVCVYQGGVQSQELAADLRRALPKYMVPNIYIQTQAIPYNANGKIDRVKLKEEYDKSH